MTQQEVLDELQMMRWAHLKDDEVEALLQCVLDVDSPTEVEQKLINEISSVTFRRRAENKK